MCAVYTAIFFAVMLFLRKKWAKSQKGLVLGKNQTYPFPFFCLKLSLAQCQSIILQPVLIKGGAEK